MHLAGGLREEHGSLACRVSSADDNNLLALAQLRLDIGCPVVNAVAFKLLEIGEARLVVLRSRSDDDGSRGQRLSAVEDDHIGAALATEFLDIARNDHAGAKFLGLCGGAGSEFLS